MELILANDNQLKKISEESIILSLLFGTKEANEEVYVWRFVGNEKHLGQARIESIRKMRNDFCVVPAEGQEELIQSLIGGQIHVDLYLPASAILLRCKIKKTDAPIRYYLQLPDFVAQVDRRKNLRLVLDDGCSKVKISFDKTVVLPRQISQHFIKDCYDIGPGGFSFYISKMELKLFQRNDPISHVNIKTGNWSGKVGAKVIHIKEITPDEHNGLNYKVWRVSCEYTQIDQISRKYLEKFVFERIKEELHAING